MVDTGQNIDSHSDGSDTNNSARKHNTYIFTLNGKDTKKVNGGVVCGAKDKPVEEHLKKIYEKLDSKPLIAKVKTDPTSLNFNQMSFSDAVQKALNNAKTPDKSSYGMVYYDKDGNPTFNSYENMFSGSSVADFIESATNTDPDPRIIINVSPFNIFMNSANIRAGDVDTSQFNSLSGSLRLKVKPKTEKFRTAGTNPGKKGAGNENNTINTWPNPLDNRYPQGKYSTAAERLNYQNLNLTDNSVELTVFPISGVDIGKNINTSILAKDDKNTTTGNPKINGKMLVRTIIHRIGAVGEEPRYTQVLQTLKGDPEGR